MLSALRKRAFYYFNRTVDRFSNFIFRGVTNTPEFSSDLSSPIVVYSVLGRRHVNAYLLGIKSFLRYCSDIPVSVVIQQDGSLDQSAEQRLRAHISDLTILSKSSTLHFLEDSVGHTVKETLGSGTTPCLFVPLKLLNVIYRFRHKYVILFDSDLLFLRSPDDVLNGLKPGAFKNFHSPGGNGIATHFRTIGFDFPIVQIERFNAGFFGFYNTLDESDIAPVLTRIAAYDRTLFSNWEIEQAIWSVLLNSCSPSRCLKDIKEKYVGNGWAGYNELLKEAVLVHFVGSTRYRNWTYPRLAKLVVNELQALPVNV